jgi:hypothetical protein
MGFMESLFAMETGVYLTLYFLEDTAPFLNKHRAATLLQKVKPELLDATR